MNDARRKQISEARDQIELAKSILESAESDEREYFDNMHENLQGGEKGQKAEAAADALMEAIDSLDTAISSIETASE